MMEEKLPVVCFSCSQMEALKALQNLIMLETVTHVMSILILQTVGEKNTTTRKRCVRIEMI